MRERAEVPRRTRGATPRAAPATVDEYLAQLGVAERNALQGVRRAIHAALPRAEECISYRLPAFRLAGRCVLWIGAAAEHCAIYGVVGGPERELAKFDRSGRGTLRFASDAPPSPALVRKIVKARVERNKTRRAKRVSAARVRRSR